jgi:saccharopine dehydrogenase (NAD+, L-lysine forming)
MSAARTVGIVGAYGATGTEVARILAGRSGYQVIVTGRSLAKATVLANELGPSAVARFADVFDEASIAELCRASDVVVNCVGPSSEVADRVARSAIEHGCHYVDPGGFEVIAGRMQNDEHELRRRGLTFLSSAGWLPGAELALLAHVDELARDELDSVEGLRLYSGDTSPWTTTGMLDSIWWVVHSNRPGVFEDGRWVPGNPFTGVRWPRLPAPEGRGLALPYFKAELERFAARRRHRYVRAYQILVPIRTAMFLFRVRSSRDPDIHNAAERLQRALETKAARSGQGGVIVAQAIGRKDGRRARVVGRIAERRHYWATGLVAATAAHMIAEGRISERGSISLSDIGEPGRFMAELASAGMEIEVSCNGFAPEGSRAIEWVLGAGSAA